LLRRLWVKEVMTLVIKHQCAALGAVQGESTNPEPSRDRFPVRRACSFSRTCGPYVVRNNCIILAESNVFNPRTSTASQMTDSRSCMMKRR
jgi:hypothetical protein